MNECKRTVLHDVHVRLGATMVDFGGWDMPIQYPTGILEEHLYTRRFCTLFDVSHMGRLEISGPDQVAFLQYVLSSNVASLAFGRCHYCILPTENGSAVDDAYLYRLQEDRYLLIVNAANIDKDLTHLHAHTAGFDVTIENISDKMASIAVQGPSSQKLLETLLDGTSAELSKNGLGSGTIGGRPVAFSKTGYTGEPLGYELFMASEDAVSFWEKFTELGARPAGLGARDTLRLEAALPLYGHEMGDVHDDASLPIFATSLARFAVNFAPEKGHFIGREPLTRQAAALKRIQGGDLSDCADLPRRIRSVALLGRGVLRAGFPVFSSGKPVGSITSGTMVPYYMTEGEGENTILLEEKGRRSIGFALLQSDLPDDAPLQVDIRGKLLDLAVVPRHLRSNVPPYAQPVLCPNTK